MTPPTQKWDDVPRPIGAVHVIHGMAEHPGRYAEFAEALNADGFVVWAHHQRGHGCHPGPKGHFADEDGWQALVDDARLVSSRLQSAYPTLPLILFAHSMGSFVAHHLITQGPRRYCAAVLSGSNGPVGWRERALRNVAVTLGWPRRRAAGWLQARIFGSFDRRFAPPKNAWLSRDLDEVHTYNTDPLTDVTLTWQAWIDLLDARLEQRSPGFFGQFPRDMPLRIMSGASDPAGEFGEGVRRLIDALEAERIPVSPDLHQGARHELLHETHRAQVFRATVDWMRSEVTRCAAGADDR